MSPRPRQNTANDAPKNGRRIIFRVTSQEDAAIREEAARRGLGISSLIRFSLAHISEKFRRY